MQGMSTPLIHSKYCSWGVGGGSGEGSLEGWSVQVMSTPLVHSIYCS